MSIHSEYTNKLATAAEAVKIVKSGDTVDYGFFNGKPVVCDEALAARADELSGVNVYTAVTLPPVPQVALKPEAFNYHDLQYSKLTRIMTLENPGIRYVPVLYHLLPAQIRAGLGPGRQVGIYRVCPMGRTGVGSTWGPQNSETMAKLERNDKVILEVTPGMPRCLGGAEEAVHISRVDYVVEAPEGQACYDAPAVEPKEAEKIIAAKTLG